MTTNVMIQYTEDLSVFKTIDCNRAVSQSKVQQLISSINEHNLLSVNPIIVNDNMEVIDGQHRLEACRQMFIGVYFVRTAEKDTKAIIPLLNSNRANWTIDDYFNFHANTGVEAYVELRQFMADHCIDNLSLAFILYSNSKTKAKDFKAGSLVKDDKHWATVFELEKRGGVALEEYPQKCLIGLLNYLNKRQKPIDEKTMDMLTDKWSNALGKKWSSEQMFEKLFNGKLKVR